MAEQFDWSKVLERMKEDGEPAAPEKASPPPIVIETASAAPAPVEVVAAQPAQPVPEEAPEAQTDALAWDENDVVVAPAPVAEKPTALSPDPVIALDWDDEPVAPFEAELVVQHESQTLEKSPVDDGPAMFGADVEPETVEYLVEEEAVFEAGPMVFVAPPLPPVAEDVPTALPPFMAEVVVPEAVDNTPTTEAPEALVEPPAELESVVLAPPMAEPEVSVPPVAEAVQPVVENVAMSVGEPFVPETEVLAPPTAQADETLPPPLPPMAVETAPVPEPELVVAQAEAAPPPLPEPIPIEASAPNVETEEVTPVQATAAPDERPKIKLLATPFDPAPQVPEVPAVVAEPSATPSAQEPEVATAQPVSFSMDDLDKLKVEQAIAGEPTPPAAKAETKKTSRTKREEPAPEPELKLVKRDAMSSFGLSDKRLGSALLDVKAITRKQLEEGLSEQVETAEPLGRVLVRKGYVNIAKVLQVVAMQRGLDAWDLESDPPKSEAMGLVSGEVCQRLGVLPVALRGDLLVLAMVDPDDSAAVEEVRKETGLRVQPVLADPERLSGLVQRNYHLDARSSSVMDTLVDQALQTAKESGHANTKERATVTEEESRPVVGFVNQIIHDAIRMHASDIHIEPRFEKAEIRYRLDGQLMTMREIPQALVPMVTTRLKIMADLDIVEYRVPQDGRMALQFGNNTIDLRVSCLPSLHGQRIVMRVLDKSIGLRRLDDLGFDPENLSILRSLVEKPYGLLLATGPTGSGKTTTLYAAIQEMRRDGQNVMTCEDPVEYDLEGVNQSQVNERVGLTFAEQLRAILRQDPDIVLVGEVRDHETAETAVRAAMTGHMVLSTLHCNDAPSAIARLLDLGIDPFLLSTSLIGTMSQRLVRRLCPTCRREEEPSPEETEMMERHFGVEGVDRVWRAIGCDKCHKTGYKGRVAVSEIMPVVEEIAALIAARAPLEQIKTAASLYGYLPMQSDAMVRVARGETSLDEARRTVFFDTIQRRATPRQIAV